MSVEVKIDTFEGPLDLLLHLIQEEELPITEVSLERIADQYIEHLESFSEREPENLAQFLVVAAQLLLIKSRALLPQEEQVEAEEAIDDLTDRLKQLAAFRKVGKSLRGLFEGPKRTFEPKYYPPPEPFFSPEGASHESLAGILKQFLASVAKERQLLEKESIEATVTVEEKVLQIQSLLKRGEKVSFAKLATSSKSKTELIVTFLSTLELMKQHEVSVEQEGAFSDIIISQR